MKTISLLLLLLLVAACETYSKQEMGSFDTEIQSYMKSHNMHLNRSESGLYFKFLKNGIGESIKLTDSVSISYKGTLLNGTVVDIQRKPITMLAKDLISGWKETLVQAKKGSEIQMILPPQLAYGDNKLSQIPENSILFFELKVWEIK
jgi:FKBP-type peptidyl-prolyl cis-trans isomerase FkpA